MTAPQQGTLTKSRLIRALELLPEEASDEEILNCVLFVVDLERAAEEIEAGNTISHEEALDRIRKWLK